MKTQILTLAAAAMLMTVPAMANDKSPEEVSKKVDEWIAKADKDGNGTISKTEFTDDAATMFDEADTNKDGQLTKEEKLAFKAAKKHD